MNIQSISLTPSDTVMYNGLLTFDIILGGTRQLSTTDIVLVIDTNVIEYQLKTTVVTIDGSGLNVVDTHELAEILELVEVLRSRGYPVVGKTHGNAAPLWLHPTVDRTTPKAFGATYTVALVTNEPWLNFAVNEVHYIPPKKGPLKEPLIYPVNHPAAKRLIIREPWQPMVVFEFLRKSTNLWSLLPDPKYYYSLTIVETAT